MSGKPQSEVSRRAALKAVTGVGLVLTVGVLDTSPASAKAGDDTRAVAGRIAAIGEDSLRLTTASGDRRVHLTARTRAYSGAFGRISGTEDFVLGDQVAAEGIELDGVLEAASVGSVLQKIEVRVLSLNDDGSVAHTNQGPLLLLDGHVPDEDNASRLARERFARSVGPGDVIAGSVWTDPTGSTRYLLIPALARS